MVIAPVSAGVADATDSLPSGASLRGLDAVNLFLAGALSGFGPYVAAFLAEQKWTQQNIGFVLTAGGFAGLLSQLPGGELLDAIRSKRIVVALGASMVASGALILALWPSFPLVLTALVLQESTGGFLGIAIAAISLGLVGHALLAERLGRNQRFASTGGVVASGLMGLIAYFFSYRAILFAVAAMVIPLLVALGRIRPSDIHFGRASGLSYYQGQRELVRTRRSLWKNRGLLVFAGCVFLFQMANASMLPLAGEALVYSKEALSSLIVAALIMVPQVIVAVMAPWVGRRANTWGRRPLLLVGFGALPIRALLFAWTANPTSSHCCSNTRWRQRNSAGRAHGADRRRSHKGYWPIQSGTGVRRNDVWCRRFAQLDTFRPRGREPRPRGGISGHRSSGPGRGAPCLVADA